MPGPVSLSLIPNALAKLSSKRLQLTLARHALLSGEGSPSGGLPQLFTLTLLHTTRGAAELPQQWQLTALQREVGATTVALEVVLAALWQGPAPGAQRPPAARRLPAGRTARHARLHAQGRAVGHRNL